MGSKALKDVIQDLGGYFGIKSADSYLNAILGASDDAPWPADQREDEPFVRGQLLNAICGGGDTSAPTTQAILDFCTANDGEAFWDDICITPHNDSIGADKAKQPVNAQKTGGEGYEDQGIGKPSGDYYTIDDIRGKEKSKDATSPLNVIQIFPIVSSTATADTDVVALFLNSIPPLEMSRAVPFLDIMAVGMVGDNPDETRDMSLGRWLLGTDVTNDTDRMLFQSDDMLISPSDDPEAFHTIANMEIFTSPQTMVPVDRLYELSNENVNTPVDPFRPFMSIESFKVNVVGAGSAMSSFKTADLSLILHDKARLNEIAPLVAPDHWGKTRFEITYGWAHPDGEAKYGNMRGTRPSDADSNRFGQLIDAMRTTETFQTVTSTFGLEPGGEIKVDLRLQLMGASSIQKFDITLGKVSNLAEDLQKMFAEIRELLKQWKKKAGQLGKVETPDFIKQISNMDSAMNMKKEDIIELQKFLKKRDKDGDLSKVSDITKKLIGKDGEDGLVADLKAQKLAAVSDMIMHLVRTPDPWLNMNHPTAWGTAKRGVREEEFSHDTKNFQHVVSLGKVLSVFVGDSLAAGSQFEEVQMIFHPFNESASMAHFLNIAQFPILLSDFQLILEQEFDNMGSMALGRFLGFLNTYFMTDPGNVAYGFAGAYGERDPENYAKRKKLEAKSKKDKKAPMLENIRTAVLQMAYGVEDKESAALEFRMPRISAKIEAVPMRSAVVEDPDNRPQLGKTMMRVHIFDQSCTQLESLYKTFEAFAGDGYMAKLKRDVPGPTPYRYGRFSELVKGQLKMLEERGLLKPVELKTMVMRQKIIKTLFTRSIRLLYVILKM